MYHAGEYVRTMTIKVFIKKKATDGKVTKAEMQVKSIKIADFSLDFFKEPLIYNRSITTDVTAILNACLKARLINM